MDASTYVIKSAKTQFLSRNWETHLNDFGEFFLLRFFSLSHRRCPPQLLNFYMLGPVMGWVPNAQIQFSALEKWHFLPYVLLFWQRPVPFRRGLFLFIQCFRQLFCRLYRTIHPSIHLQWSPQSSSPRHMSHGEWSEAHQNQRTDERKEIRL